MITFIDQNPNNSLSCSNTTTVKIELSIAHTITGSLRTLHIHQVSSIQMLLGRVFLIPDSNPVEHSSTQTFVSSIVGQVLHLYTAYQIEFLANLYRSLLESLSRILSIMIRVPYHSPSRTHIETLLVYHRSRIECSDCRLIMYQVFPAYRPW